MCKIEKNNMSRIFVRVLLMVFSQIVILYISTLIAAKTSITEKTIQDYIVINASASKVWGVLMDFKDYPIWNQFVRKIIGVAQPGEKLSIQMKVDDLIITLQPIVLTVKPEEELSWIGRLFIPGIFDGKHRFTIHRLGENKVLFIQHEDFKGILVPLSGSVLKKTKLSFKEMNQALKVRSEKII
jgi:hypothetical protein